MHDAKGILTARGGMTSHAAVVARGTGTCCVSGLGDIRLCQKEFELGGTIYNEGDYISLDGSTGNIYAGAINTVPARGWSAISAASWNGLTASAR